MTDHIALDKIRKIKQNYILYYMLADAILAAAAGIAGGIILSFFFAWSLFFAVILFVLIFGVLIAIHRQWLISDTMIASFLDSRYPELEESSTILLKPSNELNLLQQLQLIKVSTALNDVPQNHKDFTRRLRFNSILLAAALVLALLAGRVNYHRANSRGISTENNEVPQNLVKETVLPEVKSVDILVRPPAYTRLSEHQQSKFTLDVVEGAVVSWAIKTNIPVKKVSLLFNGQESLTLKSSKGEPTKWFAGKTLFKSGFYQVVVDDKRSDLYEVQVLKDVPPVIQIKTPKQYTYIDAGEKQQIILNATVSDDFGVAGAEIYATIAKGSGEAVKFKEQKIGFPEPFSNKERRYDLQKSIDLVALGMEPGDELYFYIEAQDNHAQLSRTDVYIVSIQDTAQLLSMDGIVSGANLKPEYFRSERQIILDAESLIKEKDSIGQDKFNDRSNDLGTDQKLLRLRYGKFLGEEAEGNIADPRLEGKDEAVDPKDFGDGAKIIDAYTDKHDNAEDAQFFDPTVKAQLKATLTEMWKAELQLRLHQPQEALPFAYKALRLLKDLQQKSRSYVAKTAYNPTPLKMEKRLSGDLGKIIQPTDQLDIKAGDDRFSVLKTAVQLLDQLSADKQISGKERQLLQQANLQLIEKAAAQPGTYLAAVNTMRRVITGNDKHVLADAAIVETALRKILPNSQKLPQNISSTPDMGLSKGYFLNLNHINR